MLRSRDGPGVTMPLPKSIAILTMRPEVITQMLRKHFFCVTDVHAIRKLIPRQFLCIIGPHRKYVMEAPKLDKVIPAFQSPV